jgi:hypothetical protein
MTPRDLFVTHEFYMRFTRSPDDTGKIRDDAFDPVGRARGLYDAHVDAGVAGRSAYAASRLRATHDRIFYNGSFQCKRMFTVSTTEHSPTEYAEGDNQDDHPERLIVLKRYSDFFE